MDRELNSLEILLLICVELGLNGAYELSAKTGMGVSLSSPGLKRMLDAKLLTCTLGARRSTRYEITEEGKRALRASLENAKAFHWHRELHRIFDAGPRAILLAALYSGLDEAVGCLEWYKRELISRQSKAAIDAKDALNALDQENEAFLKEPSEVNKASLIATAYRALRTNLDAQSMEMEIASLDSIRPIIQKLPVAVPDLPGSDFPVRVRI